MLSEIYDLEVSVSTLVYIVASISFILATPIAGYLIKGNLVPRRLIAYFGFLCLALAMIIRTGDFGDEPMLALAVTS